MTGGATIINVAETGVELVPPSVDEIELTVLR